MTDQNTTSTQALDAAIVSHHAWVARFRSTISGISTETFDAEEISDDRRCAFGQWLHAGPDYFGDAWMLDDIKSRHKYFHEIAAQIAVMLQRGYPRDQVDAYMTEFDAMSKQLVAELMRAKSALRD